MDCLRAAAMRNCAAPLQEVPAGMRDASLPTPAAGHGSMTRDDVLALAGSA